jgi:hypothetical protein
MEEVTISSLPTEWNEVVRIGKFMKVIKYDSSDTDDAYREIVARVKLESPTGHIAIQEIPEKSLIVFCEVDGINEASEKTISKLIFANRNFRTDKDLRNYRFSYLTP